MTDAENERMDEMEALLRNAEPRFYSLSWYKRRDAIFASPPDPDAGANEINVMYNIITKNTRPEPLGSGYWRDFCRAIAAWSDARVKAARIAALRGVRAVSVHDYIKDQIDMIIAKEEKTKP